MIADMPLAAFDIESSGTDVFTDFIVSATVVTIDGANVHADEWLLQPPDGREIPEGATNVHGITTERARAEGTPYTEGYVAIRDRLETVWAKDYLMCIMNAAFDCSMVHHQGIALGCPPLEVGAVLDPMCVDKQLDRFRKGKRTLKALCEHYGVKLGNAHDATADALAAARLAWKMLRLPELASFGDVDSLMRAQAQWRADQQAGLFEYFKRQGNDEAAASVSGEWPVQRSA